MSQFLVILANIEVVDDLSYTWCKQICDHNGLTPNTPHAATAKTLSVLYNFLISPLKAEIFAFLSCTLKYARRNEFKGLFAQGKQSDFVSRASFYQQGQCLFE